MEDWNSPELALVIACCRWPDDAARADAVALAASLRLDWPRLVRIAVRQRVEALVADGLKRAGVAIPEAERAALDQAAAATARDGLRLALVAVRLHRAFEAADIPVLFLKGSTLAVLAYGSLALKAARDIDLLVDPADEARAEALLAGLGYRMVDPDPGAGPAYEAAFRSVEKETVWRHAAEGITIDLHRRLVNLPSLIPAIGLTSPRQQVALPGGVSLPTLADDELYAYLVAHGALAGWFRLKWIADIAALLARIGPNRIGALHEAADRLGAGRCSGQALLLARRLFDTAVPAILLARFRADRRLVGLEAVALAGLGGACAETEVAEHPRIGRRINLSRLHLGHGLRYRAEVVREQMICLEDRARLPLPRRLHFLYPLLRLPLALERRVRRTARA